MCRNETEIVFIEERRGILLRIQKYLDRAIDHLLIGTCAKNWPPGIFTAASKTACEFSDERETIDMFI